MEWICKSWGFSCFGTLVTSHSVVLEAPPINATLFQTALALTARTYDSQA
eukprot:COSAG06_NODE_71206_length_186_cov_3679.954023_1_plen_49_part_10